MWSVIPFKCHSKNFFPLHAPLILFTHEPYLFDFRSWVGFDGVGMVGGVAISCYDMGFKTLLIQKYLCLTLQPRVGFETLRLHKKKFCLFPLPKFTRLLIKQDKID